MRDFMSVEDLQVYQKLCKLHIEICEVSDDWPRHERFELTGQVRRSSNSAPAQLAEKHDDRHVRNKIEGVNGSRVKLGRQSTIFIWPDSSTTSKTRSIKLSRIATKSAFGCSTEWKGH